ncbi:hypothetical protein UVI_02000180 [Ustilaginoidea virens]|uniref:Mitochondrial genome maintenance protein MGM101 n=1 Tax=Ustilaginoidea virens TaxID=1159556 RepID=A0A1B5KYT1_USTVR|nr:hypothetical protein UVI_02000180 [Ustilaginoidea virens]
MFENPSRSVYARDVLHGWNGTILFMAPCLLTSLNKSGPPHPPMEARKATRLTTAHLPRPRLPPSRRRQAKPAMPNDDDKSAARPVDDDDEPDECPPPADGTVDWATSFHGVAAKPVTEDQFRALMQPVDIKDIEVKPDGVIYLPEIKYRRRLNEAFGPMGWGLIPKGKPVVGDAMVTREYALIVDGRFVSQAQGENPYFSADQLPNAVEGCKSNALMRCCKDLGIASELWDPHFVRWFKKSQMEEAWVEHAVTKKKRTLWFRKGLVEVAYPYKLVN